MKTPLFLLLVAFYISCTTSPTLNKNQKSMENVWLSVNGLKRAYLDTAHTGITLEILFYDPWLENRDSVKFFLVPRDDEFRAVGTFQGMKMDIYADTLLRKVIKIPTDSIPLPVSFLYEIGAVYMTPSVDIDTPEWKLDTVINKYITFNVYDDLKEYKQSVDSFGLEPPVFLRE